MRIRGASLLVIMAGVGYDFAVSFLFPPNKAYSSSVAISRSRGPTRIQSTRTVAQAVMNTEAEVHFERLKALDSCQTGTEALALLTEVLTGAESDIEEVEKTRRKPLFNSVFVPVGASERPISDAWLAINTKIRKKFKVTELIELNGDRDADRAMLALFGITVGSTFSALVADQNLPGPEILRFVVVWLLSFAPLGFVGTGIATPERLQTTLIQCQRIVFPKYRQRMIQHEAGHFLMGHLLGLPIQGYSANAIKNAVEFYPLNDPDAGRTRAGALGFDISNTETRRQGDALWNDDGPPAQDVPFFSKGGRGSQDLASQSVFRNAKNYTDNPFLKIPSRNDPMASWPFRGFDDETIDKLTIVSVAGACSEILAFGNAEGGYADLSQLRQLFRAAESDLDERAMDNRIRFALGYTIGTLRSHLKSLDALADVMERGGSVAECILAIEGTSENPSGNEESKVYEETRKSRFQSDSPLERIFLYGGKNANIENERVVEGRGGGYDRPKFQISGDDPLYIALGISFVFLFWALSGGLSLH